MTADSNVTSLVNDASTIAFVEAGRRTTLTVAQDLVNGGELNLQDGAVGDRIVVGGDYVADGGRLSLDAHVIGTNDVSMGGSSEADRLVVAGDVVGGAPETLVFAAGGGDTIYVQASAADSITGEEAVLLVDVGGTSDGSAFTLGNRVVAGAYEYFLKQVDESWYLVSEFGDSGARAKRVPPAQPVPRVPPVPRVRRRG